MLCSSIVWHAYISVSATFADLITTVHADIFQHIVKMIGNPLETIAKNHYICFLFCASNVQIRGFCGPILLNMYPKFTKIESYKLLRLLY